jgi:hypothetical protein
MSPIRIVSIGIGAMALIGVVAVSDFGTQGQPAASMAEAANAAPTAAPSEQPPMADTAADDAPAADAPADGWGDGADEPFNLTTSPDDADDAGRSARSAPPPGDDSGPDPNAE